MIASLAESLIQRFCGRYLKNFSSSNVSISVTGTITLKDVELRLDSFADVQLPYAPRRCFIGKLKADLPLVIGGNFDIYVSDVFLLLSRKDEGEDIYNDETAALAMKTLQSLIGLMYTELIDASDFLHHFSAGKFPSGNMPKITGLELENMQKLIDRLILVAERIHVRIEEEFSSHIPCSIGQEVIALGVVLDRLETRAPNYTELQNTNAWNSAKKDGLLMNKILFLSGLSAYCARDEPVNEISDDDFNAAFVQSQYHHRLDKGSVVLEPMKLTISLSIMYQRLYHAYGPIKVNIDMDDMKFSFSDEHIAYLLHFSENIVNFVRILQNRSRKLLYSPKTLSTNKSKRARCRWMMIRDSIKKDFFKFVTKLPNGSIRWRIWFEQWRLVARYVAIREMLMFHVGFEPKYHAASNSMVYTYAECLLDDQSGVMETPRVRSSSILADANDNQAKKTSFIARYQGRSAAPVNIIKSVEVLIAKLLHQVGPYTAEHPKETVDSLSLSGSIVRGLYAMQLELDTLLPVNICARARVWAEDRYRQQMNGTSTDIANNAGWTRHQGAASITTSSADAVGTPYVDQTITKSAHSVAILVGVVDGAGFRASFGMSRVDAYCKVSTSKWGGNSSDVAAYTETKSSLVGAGTDTALLSWGHILYLPVDAKTVPLLSSLRTASASKSQTDGPGLTLDCEGLGFISFSYGKGAISLSQLLGNLSTMPDFSSIANNDASNPSSSYESSIMESSITVSRQYNMNGTKNEGFDVSIRLMSMLVVGDSTAIQSAKSKLQVRVNEAMEDRKIKVARQEEVAKREKIANGGMDEDDAFILDPSVLSIQDLQISCRLKSLDVVIHGTYHTPSTLRANIFSSTGVLSPYTSAVPLFKFNVKELAAWVAASSNPWSGKFGVKINKIKLWELQSLSHQAAKASGIEIPAILKKDLSIPEGSPHPVLNLRSIEANFEFSQTSTMSPFVSGTLDPSCFDWSGKISIFPITLRLSSRGQSRSNTIISTKLWSHDELLSHLWRVIEPWSLGSSSATNPPESSTKLHAEAQFRLGNSYDMNPKHLNVVRDVWGHIKHSAEAEADETTNETNLKEKILYPSQHTVITLNSFNRSLDFDLFLVGKEINVASQPSATIQQGFVKSDSHLPQSTATENDDDDNHVVMPQASHYDSDEEGNAQKKAASIKNVNIFGLNVPSNPTAQPLGGFFDWMGKNLTPINESPSLDSFQMKSPHGFHLGDFGIRTDNAKAAKPATASAATTSQDWATERVQLLERIRELEAKNRLLEEAARKK